MNKIKCDLQLTPQQELSTRNKMANDFVAPSLAPYAAPKRTPQSLVRLVLYFIHFFTRSKYRNEMIYLFITIFLFTFNGSGETASPRTKAVLINGGSDHLSNYIDFETDLKAFNQQLFDQRALILNANGSDSLVLDYDETGCFKRDFLGWVQLEKTTLKNSAPATKENIENTFNIISKNPPQNMTVLFTDHGTPSGVSLWNHEELSFHDIRSIYLKFPQTSVRSIHFHCYGGASIVNAQRVPPDDLEKLESFLENNYLSNKCSLSLSSEKEVSWALPYDPATKENSWHQLLSSQKDISLKAIESTIKDDNVFRSSPYLTSHYFVQDIANSICKTPTSTNKTATCSHSQPNKFNDIFELNNKLKEDLCHQCSLKHMEEIDSQYAYFKSVKSDADAIKNKFKDNFLRNKYPERYATLLSKYHKLEREINEALYKETNFQSISTNKNHSNQLIGKSSSELEDEKNKILDEYINKLDQDGLSLANRKDFDEYFDTLDGEWLNSNFAKQYPNFKKFYDSMPSQKNQLKMSFWKKPNFLKNLAMNSHSGDDLSNFSSSKEKSATHIYMVIKKTIKSLQLERKKAEIQRRTLCAEIAEPLIMNSKNTKIRELYESIKKCEASPLN